MDKAVMDLAALDTATRAGQGVEMEILGPENEHTGAYLSIYGADSAVWRNVVLELQEKQGEKKLGPEELYEQDIEFAAGITAGWRNVVLDGQELAFSRENVIMLYRRCPLIQRQVLPFASKRDNFFLKRP